MGWRDGVSAQALADVDSLLTEALHRSGTELSRDGDFIPFGRSVHADGERSIDLIDEPLPAAKVRDRLFEIAKRNRDLLRGTAIATRILRDGEAGVLVELWQQEGIAIRTFFPYTRSRFRHNITFGAQVAAEGERRVWD